MPAGSGSWGWRLGFGIRAGRRRTRALLTRAATEHAPSDATCPRAGAPSQQTQDGPWWRAQRRPPRDCREIRVTRLEARIRNPSRPALNPSLARGRRVCTPGVATCPLVSTTAPSPPHLTIHCWPCRLEGGVSVTHAVGPGSSKLRRKPAEWHSMAICRTACCTAAPRALPARSSAPQLLRLLT